jgi:hypothetical protein
MYSTVIHQSKIDKDPGREIEIRLMSNIYIEPERQLT